MRSKTPFAVTGTAGPLVAYLHIVKSIGASAVEVDDSTVADLFAQLRVLDPLHRGYYDYMTTKTAR